MSLYPVINGAGMWCLQKRWVKTLQEKDCFLSSSQNNYQLLKSSSFSTAGILDEWNVKRAVTEQTSTAVTTTVYDSVPLKAIWRYPKAFQQVRLCRLSRSQTLAVVCHHGGNAAELQLCSEGRFGWHRTCICYKHIQVKEITMLVILQSVISMPSTHSATYSLATDRDQSRLCCSVLDSPPTLY